MANDPWTGARLGDMLDAPAGGNFLAELVNELGAWTVPAFDTASQRDAAFSAWVANGNTAKDGMKCSVAGVFYQRIAGAWTQMWSPAAWTPFVPTVDFAGGGFSIGNGSLTGHYIKMGRTCSFDIIFTLGTTTTPGIGSIGFDGLPFASAARQQHVLATAFTTTGGNKNWYGFGYIAPSSTAVLPHFSNNAVPPYWEQARQTDGSGSAGTGIPWLSGSGTFFPGSNITVSGTYETAS